MVSAPPPKPDTCEPKSKFPVVTLPVAVKLIAPPKLEADWLLKLPVVRLPPWALRVIFPAWVVIFPLERLF